ncbi:hypothetical protein [Pseudolactococcus raffinolactis]|uniref:hypothetical protein n=1 Tax=Pseudolactococcus raffinolactis TaxID=1366 RepID=UPI001436AA6D|nr:hypothetical protein [Lactococcus raffinolactis]QIW51181.1 hypothetical protein GU337_04475 [Lactococcus raffinolactis]
MVINLQELNEKSLDFLWIDGAEIHCPMPSVRFVNKVNRSENTFEKANELALEFLNTNKEKRVFTLDEVIELSSVQLAAILGAVVGVISEVDEHPNL